MIMYRMNDTDNDDFFYALNCKCAHSFNELIPLTQTVNWENGGNENYLTMKFCTRCGQAYQTNDLTEAYPYNGFGGGEYSPVNNINIQIE